MDDPLGQALTDYYKTTNDLPVRVWINDVEDPLLYPSQFFRSYGEMNNLERVAMKQVTGTTLDIGAGAGCHALYLHALGVNVECIEWSPLMCEILKSRITVPTYCNDIMQFSGKKYDTLLLLMNGFGIAGTEMNLGPFLEHLRTLLNPGGSVIGESTDILYLLQKKNREAEIDLTKGYYGEVSFRLRYKAFESTFPWIYPDEYLLEEIAAEAGFDFEILTRGDHYNFLCRLRLRG